MAGRVYIGGSTVPRRITYVPSPTFAPTNPGETRAPSSSAPNSISPSAATSQPNSLAPITARPNSAAPSTVRPITRRPSSLAPITEEPTTGQPDSDAPTTARPNSAAPSSPRPSTARPSSASPSSQRPSTARPSSASPSSQRPTTRQPSSRRPTTFQPTLSPITEEPTTGRPNSNAPTTARPPIGGPSNVPSSLPVDQSTSAPIPQSQGTTRTPNAGTNSPSFLTPPSAIGTTGAPAQITRAPNTPPTTSDNPGDSSALSQIIIAVASAAFALSAGALLWKRYNKKPEEVNVEVIQSFRNPAFADRRTNGDDDYENPVPVAPNQYNEAGDPVSYEYEESDIHRDNKYEDPGEPDEVDPWYEVPEPIEDNGDYADISATTDSNNEDGYLDVGPGADPQEITNDAALYNTASPTIKPTREPTYAIASPDNSSNQGENPTYDTASGGLAPSAPETIYDIASRAFTQEADPNIPEKVYDMADTSQFGHHQPTTGPTYDVADPTVVTPQHQGSTHDAASADIILASPEAFEITTNTDLTEGFYDALTMPNADEVLDGPAVITKDVETFNGFGTRGIQQKDETFDGSSETEPTHHYPISTDPSVVTPGTAPLGSESQGPLEEKKKGKGK